MASEPDDAQPWQPIGSFWRGLFTGESFGLRRFGCVAVVIQTSERSSISTSEAQTIILREAADLFLNSRSESCLLVCVPDPGAWRASTQNLSLTYWLIPIASCLASEGVDFSRIRRAVLAQAKLDALNPFTWSGPCRSQMFFGRTQVISQILEAPGTSFAIVGPRRIGKTSLLFHLREQFARFPSQTYRFLECYRFVNLADFERELLFSLSPRDYLRSVSRHQSFHQLIIESASRQRTRFVVALDEFDHLLSRDAQAAERLRWLLDSSLLQGRCRFLLAGYSTLWESLLHVESAFYHKLPFITLGPLEETAARDLIVKGLSELGLQPTAAAAVDRLLRESGRLPWLLQMLCDEILKLYSRQARTFAKLVDHVLRSADVRESIVTTALISTSLLGKVSFLMIHDAKQLRQNALLAALKAQGIPVSPEALVKDLGLLRVAGFIRAGENGLEVTAPLIAEAVAELTSLPELIELARGQ